MSGFEFQSLHKNFKIANMIQSLCRPVMALHLPAMLTEISMRPFNLESPDLFREYVVPIVNNINRLAGTGYLTIHGADLKAGQTLRRPGPHIDGNYLSSSEWGGTDAWRVAIPSEIKGSGWGWRPSTRVKGSGWGGDTGGWRPGTREGRVLTGNEHDLSYNTETGGMLIVSNYPGCAGWVGEFDGDPREGGDCSHIKLDKGLLFLEPNVVYYANSRFIHETLPVHEDINRVMLRITLPISHKYAA